MFHLCQRFRILAFCKPQSEIDRRSQESNLLFNPNQESPCCSLSAFLLIFTASPVSQNLLADLNLVKILISTQLWLDTYNNNTTSLLLANFFRSHLDLNKSELAALGELRIPCLMVFYKAVLIPCPILNSLARYHLQLWGSTQLDRGMALAISFLSHPEPFNFLWHHFFPLISNEGNLCSLND